MNDTVKSDDVLAEALQLSRAMRTAAQAADWTALASLENRRGALLSPPLAPELRNHDALSALLAIDAEIRAAVEHARAEAASAWRDTRDARQAVQHYQQT